MPEPDHAWSGRARLGQHLLHPNEGASQIIRMDKLEHARPVQIRRRIAKQSLDRRALKRDRPLLVDHRNQIACVLDQLRYKRRHLGASTLRHLELLWGGNQAYAPKSQTLSPIR